MVTKQRITRNMNGLLYLNRKVLEESKASFSEFKFEFNKIPPEYAINHFTIQKIEFFAISDSKEIRFDEFSVTVNADNAAHKLTLIIAIIDKGLEILKELKVNKMSYNLTVWFPSKPGSSSLIRKETLKKINDLTLS